MGDKLSKINEKKLNIKENLCDMEKDNCIPCGGKRHQQSDSFTAKQSSGVCPMKDVGEGYQLGKLFHYKRDNFDRNVSSDRIKLKSPTTCPSVQYNVHSQPVDPRNNMPVIVQQLPGPLQEVELSIERLESSIPKGDAEGGSVWTYPSPQMFYNALGRKQKLGDIKEADIESVVALHNNMNEKTWAKIMEWERVFLREDSENSSGKKNRTKLLKFIGRPSDLSPKARLKNWIFDHPLPFDRHDWTVIRSNGIEARYIIDYYFDESQANEKENSGIPDMNDRNAIKSILVDVRPAVDSLENILCRILSMPYARFIGKTTTFEPLSMLPTRELKKQRKKENKTTWEVIHHFVKKKNDGSSILLPSFLLGKVDISVEEKDDNCMSLEEAMNITTSFASMLEECKHIQKNIDECIDESECMKASLSLNMCMAKNICPLQYDTVTKILNSEHVAHVENLSGTTHSDFLEVALQNALLCVQKKTENIASANKIIQKPRST